MIADRLEPASDLHCLRLILVAHCHDHVLELGQLDACAQERFVERLVKGLGNAKALSRGLHLWSKADISAADLLKGEYRHLDCHIVCLRLESRCVAQFFDLLPDDHLCRKRHDRDACHLADVRHSTAGTRVDLDHIHIILAAYDELDVDHTDDMKGFCKASCVLCDLRLRALCQALRRVNGDTVSGMDSRALDVLHDTRDQDIGSVAHRIYLDLLALQIFVYKDRMILRDPVDDADELINVIVIDSDLHALAAKHVGRADQNRIAQTVCHFFCFLSGKYSSSCRTRDLALFQDLVKELSVLCLVHVLRGCSEDRHSHLHERLSQLDGCLSAELYHSAVRLLDVNDALHVFRSERLKIQLVRNVKVRTYGLRVVVDDDRLVSFFRERPCTVHGTEVELDSLTDTDRTGAEDKDFFLVFRLFHLVLASVYRVVIRRLCSKLCRAGVNDLIRRNDSVLMTHIMDLALALSCQAGDHIVRELDSFCFFQKLRCEFLSFQRILHLHDDGKFIDKPAVDLCDTVNGIIINASADRLCDPPDPHIIHDLQLFHKVVHGKSCKIIGHQAVHMLLQRADRLHERSFKIIADAHDLSGRLHLSRQRPLGADELVKRQTRKLYDYIVQHRLKACVSFLRNCILNLIQCIAKGDLCRHLGDRVSCRLGRQSGRTADTRIHLDDTVFKGIRIQRVLHVTSAGNIQLADDIQCGSTEHLVFLVAQRLGRSHNDGISRVHAYRVDVFHITNCDAVARAVTHHLVLDLFPSRDTALYKNLSHTGKPQAILQDLHKLMGIMGNTAAASSQRIRRTEHYRVADLICECKTVLHIFHDKGCSHRLADLLHGRLELQAVFRLLDRLGCSSDETHAVCLQKSGFFQLHGKVQSCLSSQCREHAVRLLLQDELLYHLNSQRLDIDTVRDVFIRHDGRRVGVQQNNLKPLLLQRTARLCPRVVKLRCLSDDDRTRTDDQYFLYT